MVLIREEFVLKRAIRYGYVKRHDVLEAFSADITSEALATNTLNKAVKRYDLFLVRKGNRIEPSPSGMTPSFINDETLLSELERGATFKETGLRESELPIVTVQWRRNLPVQDGTLTEITRAIALCNTINIHYVGLKEGDSGSVRPVFPIGIERYSDQWRLIAHDLSDGNFPVKAFLLSRIIKISHTKRRKPSRVGSLHPSQLPSPLKVRINSRVTQAQRMVIENQLNIQSGVIRIPQRLKHEFLIEFCGADVSDNIVWPLIDELIE